MKIYESNDLSQAEFIEEHIAGNQPCIIKHTDFNKEAWTPHSLKNIVGDLSAQIYDALFDLQDIDSLSSYFNKHFGKQLPKNQNVPYVRWYNRLKDVDFAWGDEAFKRMSPYWSLPSCIPKNNLLVPIGDAQQQYDPVNDVFPYRGILIAAKGARTRLHRDPFCSDAIVNQFYGVKEFALFKPERSAELTRNKDGSSFGGFIDIRENDVRRVSAVPDFSGTISPGEMLFIPHGWLHDVVVTEDSISVTWNFVHSAGARQYFDYLANDAASDREFEVLQYFYSLAGNPVDSGKDALEFVCATEEPLTA